MGLTEEERKRWRDQARLWLWAQLAAWNKSPEGTPTLPRRLVELELIAWRDAPDLAGLREPSELAKMSVDERKDCRALWAEVGEVLTRIGGDAPKVPGR
jgi:serine/threonine-protein kinase